MPPHIQQAETAKLHVAPQVADFAGLETTSPNLNSISFANDNAAPRPKILDKRRRRRARLWAR